MSESDVTAISWSNYGQERSRIEYETKIKYAEIIQRKIVVAREAELAPEFIFGLELAKSLIFNSDTDNQ